MVYATIRVAAGGRGALVDQNGHRGVPLFSTSAQGGE